MRSAGPASPVSLQSLVLNRAFAPEAVGSSLNSIEGLSP
jgi:hypothetical protein